MQQEFAREFAAQQAAARSAQEAQELAVLAVLEPGANGNAVVDLRDR